MKARDLNVSGIQDVLKITDFENFFDVYLDQHGNYSYNLNKNLYFKFEPEYLPKYECKHQMFWPLISYEIYGTTRLAWLLMKLNDVQPEQMFEPKMPGDEIVYIKPKVLQPIVEEINDYDKI